MLSSEWETQQSTNVQVSWGVGGWGWGGSEAVKGGKKWQSFTSSTAGNKSGIFPRACSSHVKAILITILPVTLLTLDCRSLNYIWARILPFYSGLLNAWTGIDLVFDAVLDWFLWLAAQEVASLSEVQKEGSPSTFLSSNSITKNGLKSACDVLCLCTCPMRVHVIFNNWSELHQGLA